MAGKSNLGLVFLAASSFIGGIGLGFLLAPRSGRENREWLEDHAAELANWVDKKGRDTYIKGNRHFSKIRKRIEHGYSDTIPDLYKATEQIDLDRFS